MTTEATQRPTILYKYRVADGAGWQHVQRIFTHGEVYMASRRDFNDPFDCRFVLTLDGSKQQLRRYVDRILRKSPIPRTARRATVNDIVKNRRERLPRDAATVKAQLDRALDRQVGILCLTARPDHILMWSHYAAAHSGFCVGFDTSASDSPFKNASAIRYSEEYPVCRPVVDDPMVVQAAAVLTKSIEWEYEKEWRLIDFVNGPGTRRIDPRHIVEIILGARMPPAKEAEVRALASSACPNAAVLRATLKPAAYGLDLAPLARSRAG